MPLQPIIAWDYLFAPNAQKSRLYLYLTKTPFSICEQPFVLPRPDLTALGITYRRVPVLSIGKDVFPDNASFLAAMQELLKAEGRGRALRECIWDGACEAWGYRSFWIALACLDPDFLSEELAKDRADLFPVFARKDFAGLQNSARSEFRAFLEGAEGGFLKDGEGPFVGGEQEVGMADVHAVWMVKWYVSRLFPRSRWWIKRDSRSWWKGRVEDDATGNKAEYCSRADHIRRWIETIGIAEMYCDAPDDLPKIYKWMNSLPSHATGDGATAKLTAEEATKQVLASDYALPDIGVDEFDRLGLRAGDWISIEPMDAKPGTYPQLGRLVGLNRMKTVIQLDNGLRLHFPKVGYNVKRA